MTLAAADFFPFYSEINGVDPFPWQEDLVEQVLGDGAWPDLIDIPTGLGKTALIDIAVFVAAATAHQAGAQRLGRRRMFFVVDRRIVVDEAHHRADVLAAKLDDATEGSVAHRVALALRSLAPYLDRPLAIPPPLPLSPVNRRVLRVTKMRGGVTWDAAWLDRPDVPGVVVGTVDQVGSRLLFRGYGVSDRRKPIDAALAGMDSLVLVDEAHLAEAMTTTLDAAQRRDQGDIGLPRATIVQLTATPGRAARRPYRFCVDAHRSSDEAWRRLNAPKRLSLLATDVKRIVESLAVETVRCVTDDFDTVLVVCNTVDRARQVHAALQDATRGRKASLDASVDLLIGRSRPADRDLLVGRLLARFGTERSRAVSRAAILVATQTVEVGANLDADALVTESAPWDALVQRLGRLNRLGKCASEARAVVVHDDADSPVYGASRSTTWVTLSRLVGQSTVDVSPLACRELTGSLPEKAWSERRDVPLLTIPMLDGWTRTAPVPVPDAPIPPYLHGLERDVANVSIAWRDGLLAEDPMDDDAERADVEIDADLSMLPVLAPELVEVPLHAARRWLAGETLTPVSDLDDDETLAPGRPASEPFRALAWRDSDGRAGRRATGGAWVWVEALAIRPGDVLVVPTERGGLDDYGWAPVSKARVLDVAEVVRFGSDAGQGTPRGRLRLDARTASRLGLSPADRERLERSRDALKSDDTDADETETEPTNVVLIAAVGALLAGSKPSDGDGRLSGTAWTRDTLERLVDWLPRAVLREAPAAPGHNDDGLGPRADGCLLVTPRDAGVVVDRDDEQPECSSMGLAPVSLRAHHRNVGDRARQMAEALGLADALCDAVEAAARWHDLGKVEPRFQAMLCGGDLFAAMLVDEPLAKSGLDPTDRAAFWRARARSRLPTGARHEAWSAAFVRRHLSDLNTGVAFDVDLVVHLVASHHGHARPWLPPVVDDHPGDVTHVIVDGPGGPDDVKVTIHTGETVDFEQPARFAHLNRRYGRWGLALLESIVRCADMTVSGEGS
jgi:CRISPR-associated endonuclease/helicase Cas3